MGCVHVRRRLVDNMIFLCLLQVAAGSRAAHIYAYDV